jgi:hypothetical protein
VFLSQHACNCRPVIVLSQSSTMTRPQHDEQDVSGGTIRGYMAVSISQVPGLSVISFSVYSKYITLTNSTAGETTERRQMQRHYTLPTSGAQILCPALIIYTGESSMIGQLVDEKQWSWWLIGYEDGFLPPYFQILC